MDSAQTWSNLLLESFQDLWLRFINFLPELVAAIFVFIIGWLIAVAIERIIVLVVEKLWIEKASEKIKLKELLDRAEIRMSVGQILGALVKWFFILIFLLAASDILGLSEVTGFLDDVLGYVPNVVVAVVILLLGLVFGRFAERIVGGSVKAARLATGHMLGGLAKWMIYVFAVLAALVQLQIADDLLQTLFTGFIAMLAIAGGLAFGLGGRDEAQRILGNLRRDLTERRG